MAFDGLRSVCVFLKRRESNSARLNVIFESLPIGLQQILPTELKVSFRN